MFITNADRLIVFREIICVLLCLWEWHETISILATRRVCYWYSTQCIYTYLLQGFERLGPFFVERPKENFHLFLNSELLGHRGCIHGMNIRTKWQVLLLKDCNELKYGFLC